MASIMQTKVQNAACTAQRRGTMVAARPVELCTVSVRSAAVQPTMAPCSMLAAPTRAVSVVPRASAAPAAPSADKATKTEWYAVVASAEFFFNDVQNESLAEQLRERVRFLNEQGKEADFYFVVEPKWLDAKYPQDAKRVKRPAVALVSTDKNWIVFMKLRLDRVLRFDLGEMPAKEVLAAGGSLPKFNPPAQWTAPYGAYTPGWWEKFFPKA